MKQLFLVSLAVALLLGCGEDGATPCGEICSAAVQCAESGEVAFSGMECERQCGEDWQKIETIGCLEPCREEFECIYEKLGDSCEEKAVEGAADICDQGKDGCFDCLGDAGFDISLKDLTFSGARQPYNPCYTYCNRMVECDENGIFTEEWRNNCESTCGAAEEQGAAFITDGQERCAEDNSDCDAFFECLQNPDGDEESNNDREADEDGCFAVCAGKQCGDDRCDGICGNCESGLVCVDYECVPFTRIFRSDPAEELAFSLVSIGDKPERSITIYNDGNGVIHLYDISNLEPQVNNPFVIIGYMEASVQPGSSFVFKIRVEPAESGIGEVAGRIRINNDSDNNPQAELRLSVTIGE